MANDEIEALIGLPIRESYYGFMSFSTGRDLSIIVHERGLCVSARDGDDLVRIPMPLEAIRHIVDKIAPYAPEQDEEQAAYERRLMFAANCFIAERDRERLEAEGLTAKERERDKPVIDELNQRFYEGGSDGVR